jgi:tRNA(Ile2) C34 agmatinyltransferase TiaS
MARDGVINSKGDEMKYCNCNPTSKGHKASFIIRCPRCGKKVRRQGEKTG